MILKATNNILALFQIWKMFAIRRAAAVSCKRKPSWKKKAKRFLDASGRLVGAGSSGPGVWGEVWADGGTLAPEGPRLCKRTGPSAPEASQQPSCASPITRPDDVPSSPRGQTKGDSQETPRLKKCRCFVEFLGGVGSRLESKTA